MDLPADPGNLQVEARMSNQNHSIKKVGPTQNFSFGAFVATGVFVALIFVLPFAASGNSAGIGAAQKQKKSNAVATAPSGPLQGLPITDLNESEAILHALNRLTYGPRPGDLEAVRQMGLAKWIDLQLNRIP